MTSCFIESFKGLEDHKWTNKGNFRHSLQEIILPTISALLCGFQTYELIEYFGKNKKIYSFLVIVYQRFIYFKNIFLRKHFIPKNIITFVAESLKNIFHEYKK